MDAASSLKLAAMNPVGLVQSDPSVLQHVAANPTQERISACSVHIDFLNFLSCMC
jgi:hypothetical protein